MIFVQIVFDIIIAVSFYALWTCYQTIARSHYNLTQWIKSEFDKR